MLSVGLAFEVDAARFEVPSAESRSPPEPTASGAGNFAITSLASESMLVTVRDGGAGCSELSFAYGFVPDMVEIRGSQEVLPCLV